MSVFKRIYCQCKNPINLHKNREKLREVTCPKCGAVVKNGQDVGNYFISYYINGRKKTEKVSFNKSLAEAALRKRLTEIAEGRFLDIKKEHKVKFEDFVEEYLHLHCANHRGVHKAALVNLKVLKRFFGGKYLSEIDVRAVQEFKVKRKQEGVSDATVNRALACLKSMFNRAKEWDKFSGDNPVCKVKLFKESNGRARYLEREEIARLINACTGNLKAIVIVAVNTGMRRGEIFGLKWRDLDFNRKAINLLITKNGEKREIPMNEDVISAFISVRKHPQSPYVFCYEDGNPVRDIRKGWLKAMKQTGIKDFVFHQLRHTFCSQSIMAGVDMNTVREIAGHKSMQMTLRYSHLSQNHKQRAVDILAQRLGIKECSPKIDNVTSVEHISPISF